MGCIHFTSDKGHTHKILSVFKILVVFQSLDFHLSVWSCKELYTAFLIKLKEENGHSLIVF